MIEPQALLEAFDEYLDDRTVIVGSTDDEDAIAEMDKEISEIQRRRIETLRNATSEDRKETAESHIQEYHEKGRYFPEGKTEANYEEILINDICVFTDLYEYELEFGDSTMEEINTLLRLHQNIETVTTAMMGGAKAIYENFRVMQDEAEKAENQNI